MPPTLLARRPAFLAAVPEVPTAEPARFPAGASVRPPASLRHAEDQRRGAHSARGGGREAADSKGEPDRAAVAAEVEAIRREAMEKVDAALGTLRAQADHLAEQARADALEIGFQVARKILEAELHAGPDALFALVRAAVRRAGESRRITVRLAPDDAALLQTEAGRASLDGVTAARIELLADAGLGRGDCVVETDFGQVDGRLATRLAEVRRAVEAAAAEGAA